MSGTPLAYEAPAGFGTRYDYERPEARFGSDEALSGTALERAGRLPALMSSPHWEDRVRACAIVAALTVSLPDAFPCIVEVEGSPNLHDRSSGAWKYARPYDAAGHVWVAHPDVELLRGLLPEYQQMWDAYTSAWGPSARRLFAVELVSGAHVRTLRRADATVDDILRQTAATHGMRLPQRLG